MSTKATLAHHNEHALAVTFWPGRDDNAFKTTPRDGWAEASKAIAASGDDKVRL